MKRFVVIFMLMTILASASVKNVRIFETPTALVREKGAYSIAARFYRDNGIYIRSSLTVNHIFSLGIMEYVDGFVGNSRIVPSIPGVHVKISVLDNPVEDINIAFGYDAVHTGSFSQYGSNKIYGGYFAFTKGFFLVADEPHIFNFGVIWPILKESYYPFPFIGAQFHFGSVVTLGTEISGASFAGRDPIIFLNNHVLKFNAGEYVFLSVSLQMALKREEGSLDPKLEWARNVNLGYKNYF